MGVGEVMKAFESDVALFVTELDPNNINDQLKLMQLTSTYGAILFMAPPSGIKVTDVTKEVEEFLKT